MYEKRPQVGAEDKSIYTTGRCRTKPQCTLKCDQLDDCAAVFWNLDRDMECASNERRCRFLKMTSHNFIDDTKFIHGINVDLYLKDGVIGNNS